MPPDGAADVRRLIDEAPELTLEPPRPLMREIPPADPFPIDALGSILGNAAGAIHDRVQAPLAVLSGAAHSRLRPMPTSSLQSDQGGQSRSPISSSQSRKPTSARASVTRMRYGLSGEHENSLRDAYDADWIAHQDEKFA